MTLVNHDFPTPFVYVDENRLEANIALMAESCRAAGVGLRPHVKTHKTAAIARLQLDAGALGLTVAKLDEAEAFIAAGIHTSFLVAQPWWGSERAEAMLNLAAEDVEMFACVDHLETARSISEVARRSARTVEVVIIVDTGYGRFGVAPDDVVRLARECNSLPGISVAGVRSYAGILYQPAPHEERLDAARHDGDTLARVADQLTSAGMECRIVSVGNSPHARLIEEAPLPEQITELRAGNYVFGDRMQVDLGADRDHWALSVVTSVVSAPDGRRAIVDAGLKTLSSTRADLTVGIAGVLDHPELLVEAAWEECARVIREDGGPLELRPGDRLQLIPNHSCELPNLAEEMLHGRGGTVVGSWRPTARGKVH